MDNDASEGHMEYYLQFLISLDDERIDVTSFEADFLESLLRWLPEKLSPKQVAVIRSMTKRYLGENI